MDYILLATDFPPQVGGIQTYHSSLARALQQLGREVHVIATDHPEAAEHDASALFPITRVDSTGGKPRLYRRMRDEAVRLGGGQPGPPRGIISTKWSPEGPGALQAARRLGVPWGVFGHDREHILHAANLLKWALQYYLYHQADFCFAISHYAADNFRRGGAARGKVRMVGCGIDAEQFAPDPKKAEALRERHGLEGKRILVTVARLVPRKGHLTVIEALPRIRQAVADAHYLIVGEGEQLPALRRAVAQRGLDAHVTFTGRAAAEDLRGYYTLGDVMVMPSHDLPGVPTEGFGLTFLEANCCGTPVIGTRTGGIPDAVDHGLSGLLVPPRDPAALARAAVRLLADSELTARLGAYGQQRARRMFSWELVARRVDAAFEELQREHPC
jgi:phosphatidylinositol alpha-1,6-mannosyltransferase